MFENFLQLFIEHMLSERNASKNTVVSYVSDINYFLKCIGDLESYSHLDIERYLEKLSQEDLNVSSIKRKISALRQFFAFLKNDELIIENPMKFISQPKSRRPLPKIIDEDIMSKLFQAADSLEFPENIRCNLMLNFLYGSGLRVSELISLRRNSFSNEKFIRIIGKGNRERIVPLASSVIPIAEKWLSISVESKWLFPSIDSSKHITRQRVFQILKKLAMISGVDVKKISPHVLRHACATHILDNGADLLSVKKILGHQEIATTEIYTHVSKKKLRKIIYQHHPLVDKS